MSTKLQRKGRTLKLTIDELFDSPRLKIAVDLFYKDPLLLKAIMVELGKECLEVSKYRVIRDAIKFQSLDKFGLKTYLSSINDFDKFNIHWKMTDVELQYYKLNPKNQLEQEEKEALFEKVKKQFGME